MSSRGIAFALGCLLTAPGLLFAADAPSPFPPLPQAPAVQDYHIDVPKIKAQAEKGDPLAEAFLGDIYYQGWNVPKDAAEGIKWYRKAANDGNAAAQVIVGNLYAKGTQVPQDHAEAAKWFRKAAEQDNVNAQVLLGLAYGKGEGVPKDGYEALKWFHKAADKNNYLAQTELCLTYHEGNGVVKDYVKTHVWCTIANGNMPASKALLAMSLSTLLKDGDSHLDPDQLAEARRLATAWRPFCKYSFRKEY